MIRIARQSHVRRPCPVTLPSNTVNMLVGVVWSYCLLLMLINNPKSNSNANANTNTRKSNTDPNPDLRVTACLTLTLRVTLTADDYHFARAALKSVRGGKKNFPPANAKIFIIPALLNLENAAAVSFRFICVHKGRSQGLVWVLNWRFDFG